MIPKVIHYCWFGGKEKPKKALKCIASWKKYCPDYKIIEWNESNFNFEQYPYAKYCFENGKWAFLSDFVRLVVIYENGGLYFDTDVEVIRGFDDLLKYDLFVGFEDNSVVNTGQGFGAALHNEIVHEMMQVYLDLKKNADDGYDLVPCPALNTYPFMNKGFNLDGTTQVVGNSIVLSMDYLNPYDDPTGVLRKTKNTHSIHWYSKSWMAKKYVIRSIVTKPLHRIFGKDFWRNNK